MNRARNLVVEPGNSLNGTVTVPGDKSISHRALLIASMAEGITEIHNLLEGEDCLATCQALRSLHVRIDRVHTSHYLVHGNGKTGFREPENVLDMGNSGTGMRLLAGLLAGQPFLTILTGDDSLRNRPMNRIVEPLRMMGTLIDGRREANKAPLAIRGGNLKGICYASKRASAQVKSAILLAALNAAGKTKVIEPGPSRDHSERMLRAFGADIRKEGLCVEIDGNSTLTGQKIEVPGDFSSSAFLIAAAIILRGSCVTVSNVGLNPTRTGLLDVLKSMDANIEVSDQRLHAGEEVGQIHCEYGALKPTVVNGPVVVRMIDEFPILAVLAASASGKTIIQDAEELRVKESDRIATMAQALNKMGATVHETKDGMVIHGGTELRGTVVDSGGDHRVAMAMVVAGLAAKGETVIQNTETIATSFPGFVPLMQSLGATIREEGADGS